MIDFDYKPYTFKMTRKVWYGRQHTIYFEGTAVQIVDNMDYEDLDRMVKLLNAAFLMGQSHMAARV